MKILPTLLLAAVAVLLLSPDARAQSRAQYESMVATHASANNVPEALVHRVIVRESRYPKGSPSPDPSSRMSTDELAAKFRANAEGVISAAQAARIIDAVLNLERVTDIGVVMRDTYPERVRPTLVATAARLAAAA